MKSLLDALWPPTMVHFVVVVVVLVLVLVGVMGYTIGARFIGFGPHVVKRTTSVAYEAGSDVPVKTTESEEKQTGRTIWDWMTSTTISAAPALGAIFSPSSGAYQQPIIQEQQAREAPLLSYYAPITQL